MKYTSINIQGNLISDDILHKIEVGEETGQQHRDFGFDSASDLRNDMEYAWSRIKLDWKHFYENAQKTPSADPYGTSMTRRWMVSFLSTLNFSLVLKRSSLTGDNNQTYAISHTAENLDELPVHIVGFHDPAHPEKITLDLKTSGGSTRLSPHGTMQEYLNVTEHLYGLVTNGFNMRLIRDSGRLIKLTYLDFDLKRMLEDDKYSEFTILYRMLHASRFPKLKAESDQCLLEKWYTDSIESGNRIRDGLSMAVKKSLVALGNGLLQTGSNYELREKLRQGTLSPKDFYRQLRRLIYRLLFLMVTEERDLIYDPDDQEPGLKQKKQIYFEFYSLARLRKLSRSRYLFDPRYTDLWQGLQQTFALFSAEGKGIKLGIQPLAGDLFSSYAIQDLDDCLINNQLLLECIRNLNEFVDESGNLVSINYRSLDVEEFGSVYEGLLDLHPIIEGMPAQAEEEIVASRLEFLFHEGTDRKTTASYYTRPDLVNELIKSALIPVIQERIKENSKSRETREKALLDLKVCDPASGSGHFLLAAARTIAWYLAQIRSGEDNPAPGIYRACLREVIQHCIYGVDLNPDAVELCKLALWIESHNSGKPLSFLDHKIRCGNSLVGVTDLSVLKAGIPDGAFDPVTSDDKKVCQTLKRANASFRRNPQFSLFDNQTGEAAAHQMGDRFREVDQVNQDSITGVTRARQKFEQLRNDSNWLKEYTAADMWTSAFFYTYTQSAILVAPTSEQIIKYLNHPAAAFGPMVGHARALSVANRYFHWPLEFPAVFEKGGFDVILGNPPWERIKLEEQQFFATKEFSIAKAKNKAERGTLIKQLPTTNPSLWSQYVDAMHKTESESKFIRFSNRFPLSARGDINTYLIFTELVYSNLRKANGRSGIIIPIGLVAESTSSVFFEHLINNESIESCYSFVNTKKIFADVKDYIKFGLMTFGRSASAKFSFWLTDISQIGHRDRVFSVTKEEIRLINPNTKTCPIFRTLADAIITKKVHSKLRILDLDVRNDGDWAPTFKTLFHMSNDSHEFIDEERSGYLPLIEAKMIWNFDHRFSTYENASQANINEGNLPQFTSEMHSDPGHKTISRYYIPKESLKDRTNNWQKKWFLAFRGIAATNNERTFIYSIIPYVGAGNSAPVIVFPPEFNTILTAAFLANANSLIYDFIGRQKAAGSNLNFYIVKQMPVLLPNEYSPSLVKELLPKIIELVYNAWDIKSFADDLWTDSDDGLKIAIRRQWQENKYRTGGNEWIPPKWCEIDPDGCPLPPFKWDNDRRALLKAELDAIYAKLYGLTTDELRYILDPQDVYGPDFPGETFRVLKEKEIRLHGEYRTKRLVMEAWERMDKDPSFSTKQNISANSEGIQ
jgi:hypothetical protein